MPTTAAQLQLRESRLVFYLRIEGIGAVDPADGLMKQLYVFDELPDWVPGATKLFRTGLKLPQSFTESAPLMGGVGSGGSLSVEIVETTDNFFSTLFATERWRQDPASFPQSHLDTDATPTAASYSLGDVTDFPASGHVFIGNDTASYAGRDLGLNDLTGVVPGLFPAEGGANWGKYHRVLTERAILPTVTTVPYTFFSRKVVLYATHQEPDGTWRPEVDAARVFTGPIRTLKWNGDRQSWGIQLGSLLDVLDRDIFAGPVADAPLSGYWLGSAASARTVGVIIHFLASPGYGTAYEFTMNTFYVDFDAFIEDFNARALAAAPSPLTRVYIGQGPFFVGTELRAPDQGGAGDSQFAIELPVGVGAVLNLEPGTITLNVDDSDDLGAGIAVNGAAFGTFIEAVGVTGVSIRTAPGAIAFVADQGDDVAGEATRAFVIIDGGDSGSMLVRVTAVAEDDTGTLLTGDTIEMTVGDRAEYIALRYAHWEAPIRVRQVFRPAISEPTLPLSTLLLRLMTSTGGGVAHNGVSDIYPVGWGTAIRRADIDVTSFGIFASIFGRQYTFMRPRSLKDLLDEECKTIGAVITVRGGLITARRTPQVGLVSATAILLDETNKAEDDERMDLSETPDGLYNVISIRVGWDEAAEEFRGDEIPITDSMSVDAYHQTRKFSIENKGIPGSEVPNAIVYALMDRLLLFRTPYRRLARSFDRSLWLRLAPGDEVLVTENGVPSPFTGSRGLTNVSAFLESVTTDLDRARGSVVLRLFPIQTVTPLAPSAMLDHTRVDGGHAAGTLHLRANEFSNAGENDTNWFVNGDRILIVQSDALNPGAPLLWRRTATVVALNTLTLDAALAAPAFDATRRYIVTFDVYGTVVVGQFARAVWVGDDVDGNIGATQDSDRYTD